MEKARRVKRDIYNLIAGYLGEPTAKTFFGFYEDETLPIYADAALKLLGDFAGKEKITLELRAIFIRNHTEHAYV